MVRLVFAVGELGLLMLETAPPGETGAYRISELPSINRGEAGIGSRNPSFAALRLADIQRKSSGR